MALCQGGCQPGQDGRQDLLSGGKVLLQTVSCEDLVSEATTGLPERVRVSPWPLFITHTGLSNLWVEDKCLVICFSNILNKPSQFEECLIF